ncbi:MAG: outer membrane beta-barrel protein [Tannerellaceae bacterium]|nr:outer membrane beta-barrel protein [Tannerellaceae bacterium]
MKRLMILIALIIPVGLSAVAIGPVEQDTTILVNNKRIKISEDGERTKVKVYELVEDGEYVESEQVFEGHYIDGKSYERRKHMRNISIPVPSWDRDFSGHWAGFGMGFANFADGSFHFNDIDGVSLRSGKSMEYNVNFLEKSFRIPRTNWALVTGMGMRWNRYRIDTNSYFLEVDGVTILQPAPAGIHLSASKLNTTSLTIPLLMEWQTRKRHQGGFFVSGGVVGVIKTMSSSKITYRDENGKNIKRKWMGE